VNYNGTLWVVGPVAWDVVTYVNEFPVRGRYTHPLEVRRRVGGTAANVALALARAGVKTSFVTALGRDDLGDFIAGELQAGGFDSLHIARELEESGQVLVLVQADGERTIIGIGGNDLTNINLVGCDVQPGDTVVFVVWNPSFKDDLDYAKQRGATTFVGLSAVTDPSVSGDYAFGSLSDLTPGFEIQPPLDRFDTIVVTRGAEGSTLYTSSGVINQSAFEPTEVVDTTGAGDAFLAGFLLEYVRGDETGARGLETGSRWASLMVGLKESVPPYPDATRELNVES
jgi:ribokinase